MALGHGAVTLRGIVGRLLNPTPGSMELLAMQNKSSRTATLSRGALSAPATKRQDATLQVAAARDR